MKTRQARFEFKDFAPKNEFGGSLLTRRKFRTARPVSTNESMHLVLKSSLARGRFSLRTPKNKATIGTLIRKHCAKYGVKLIRYSNNFNHLHLHLKFTSRELYKRFVRAITGHIAIIVTGANKLRPLAKIIGKAKFWDARPFSRIVHGRRAFKIADDYVRLNQLEADGKIPKRDDRLRGLRTDERMHFTSESPHSSAESIERCVYARSEQQFPASESSKHHQLRLF